VTDLVVQMPIGIAANVCDVNVGILIRDLRDDAAACDAAALPEAITTHRSFRSGRTARPV
jgi:hypothetical protein